MRTKFRVLCVVSQVLALADANWTRVAETCALTGITGGDSNPPAALPRFAHWIPQAPPGAPTLYITNAGPGWATLWWTPATGTNWVLQERLSLSSGAWTNAPSGWTNPVTVPGTWLAKFCRLFQP
jgi:hypothetical protein